MKYSNQCPKCGSREIFLMDDNRSGDEMQKGNAEGTSYYCNVTVQQYICCKCGYSEQWVDRFSIGGIPVPQNAFRFSK